MLTYVAEFINQDPYGEGWICEIAGVSDDYDALLDAAAYEALTRN